jgi:predicted ferric reductase
MNPTDSPIPGISFIDLTSYAGLTATGLLTFNLLLGLLLSTRYNTVVRWPHRRLPLYMLHNWTGYIPLAATLVHPVLLLPSATARFGWLDLVLPFWAPSQPIINTIGVFAAYALIFVVVTSYLRKRIGLGTWKKLHYVAYAVTIALFAHSILTSPNLDDPIDFTDGGKVFIEACTMIALAAITWRILYGAASPKAHRHDGLVQVAGQGRRRSPRASSWPDDGERRQVFACCSLGGSSSGL